jgi:hypothetical protein
MVGDFAATGNRRSDACRNERLTDAGAPLVLFVPGLLPKPPAAVHREAMRRCLVEGVRRVDPAVADRIRASEHGFDLVAWTWEFYHEHRDIALDAPAIDAVIEQGAATMADIREVETLRRRSLLWLYRTVDFLPFLIPHVATERIALHLRDLHRYLDNHDGIADRVRELLKEPLRTAREGSRPVLLIGHSMGSVIAYDTLWQLSREEDDPCPIDLWLTMGSPLGQRYLQRRLLGHEAKGALRYPAGVRRWVNLAAVGDLTAIDPELADDFAPMLRYGLVESIEDLALYGHFRADGELNVHSEYGYLANAVTGKLIADWWRRNARPEP